MLPADGSEGRRPEWVGAEECGLRTRSGLGRWVPTPHAGGGADCLQHWRRGGASGGQIGRASGCERVTAFSAAIFDRPARLFGALSSI